MLDGPVLWARTFLLGVLLTASLALADPGPASPRVRLEIEGGPAGCFDAQAVRDSVAARLGYQPFDDRAGSLVRISFTSREGGLWARVVRWDEGGRSLGERGFSGSTCAQLLPEVELALAIAIDPLSLTRPPAAPAPAATPAPAILATAPSPLPLTPASPPGAPLAVSAQAGRVGGGGLDQLGHRRSDGGRRAALADLFAGG